MFESTNHNLKYSNHKYSDFSIQTICADNFEPRIEVIVASNSSLQLPAANAHSKQQKRPGSEHSQTGAVGTDKARKTRKTTTGKDDKKEKSKRKSQTAVSQVNPEVKNSRLSPKEISVPDETGIERTDGKMYSAGNRSLHNLNLSRNQVRIYQTIFRPILAPLIRPRYI